VLDANVFIQAARGYYAFEIAPKFWEELRNKASNGRVFSIDRVKRELVSESDELAQWVENEFANAFASTNQKDVLESYAEIVQWVQAQSQFKNSAKAEFFGGADGWLVAYAKVKDCVIATLEVFNRDIKRKVPIPNVGQAFNVEYVDTFAMLRALKITLA
jgi:hypothetical protein